MSKEEFMEQVRLRIQEFLPPKYKDAKVEVRQFDILDEKRYGLALIRNSQERVPVLDLEEPYKYIDGGRELDNVLERLAENYERISSNEIHADAVVVNKTDLLEGLHTAVLNFEGNKEFLSDLPYLKINDLAVAPMICMPDGSDIFIPMDLAENLSMSGDILLAKAMKNHSTLLPPVLVPLNGKETLKEDIIELNNSEKIEKKSNLYILTNRNRQYGAASIADKNTLAVISYKLGESFYLLPCNIHEIAVVPESVCSSLSYLKNITGNLNQKYEQEGEHLSDNVYFYDADRNVVKMYDGKLRDEKVQARTDEDIR